MVQRVRTFVIGSVFLLGLLVAPLIVGGMLASGVWAAVAILALYGVEAAWVWGAWAFARRRRAARWPGTLDDRFALLQITVGAAAVLLGAPLLTWLSVVYIGQGHTTYALVTAGLALALCARTGLELHSYIAEPPPPPPNQ